MARFLISFLVFVTAFWISPAQATEDICRQWEAPKRVARLDADLLPEASGLAISRQYDRSYLVNDSGDGAYFYVMDKDGTRAVKIKGFTPIDTEEIAIGPCPGSDERCLAVADIGDNKLKRNSIEIVYIREEETFGKSVRPVYRQELIYPDGPHNAEAMAVLPSGSVAIITKERPALVYLATKGESELRRIGSIKLPEEAPGQGVVTAMSLTSDGLKTVLLTYENIIELRLDFGPSKLKLLREPQVTPLTTLPQQESVSYARNERDLFVTSETASIAGYRPPILSLKCKF